MKIPIRRGGEMKCMHELAMGKLTPHNLMNGLHWETTGEALYWAQMYGLALENKLKPRQKAVIRHHARRIYAAWSVMYSVSDEDT